MLRVVSGVHIVRAARATNHAIEMAIRAEREAEHALGNESSTGYAIAIDFMYLERGELKEKLEHVFPEIEANRAEYLVDLSYGEASNERS